MSVKGTHTRPTSDRVREALFSILGPIPRDAVVLDLYAGTGALGIEALSRGARRATFIDRDLLALATVRKNIDHCGLQSCTQVFSWDIAKNLNCLESSIAKFDLVFIDPPYHKNLVQPALAHLLWLEVLSIGATVVSEHAADETIHAPAGLLCEDRRTYGHTQITFLTLRADSKSPA